MPHAPDLTGHALDQRYELHALIGEGAFGRVYKGWDRRLERYVAIKVIKPWWADDPDWAGSFEREARLVARISHPGIVQIFDVGHADEGFFYVSELVQGESLAARIARRPLAPWDAAAVTEQLCRALGHAHRSRVIHRDVKPANILISIDGQVKIGDFGVARLAEGSTDGASATIVGTPRYMAPEQARGRRPTPATDVYSAGIVLYELLAGQPPFTERAMFELALRHLNDAPDPLPAGTPPQLQRVVTRALAKDPADRFVDGAEMADALAHARAGARIRPRSRVLAPRPDPRRRDTPTRRAHLSRRHNLNPSARRRSIAALTAAFLVLGAMIAGALALAAAGHVRVPRLIGLTESQVQARASRLSLQASFRSSYSHARKGTAIAQSPADHANVSQGSTVRVTLSAGPPPVPVPQLAGEQLTQAQASLRRLGLGWRTRVIVAPGVPAGTVTSQSPAPEARLAPPRTVTLNVAEVPRWQPLTVLSGSSQTQTISFHARGPQWRVVYTMGYQGTCTLIFWCSGPQLQVTGPGGSTAGGFGLSDGGRQTHVFSDGAGDYRLTVSPGSDSARWQIWVEDWF